MARRRLRASSLSRGRSQAWARALSGLRDRCVARRAPDHAARRTDAAAAQRKAPLAAEAFGARAVRKHSGRGGSAYRQLLRVYSPRRGGLVSPPIGCRVKRPCAPASIVFFFERHRLRFGADYRRISVTALRSGTRRPRPDKTNPLFAVPYASRMSGMPRAALARACPGSVPRIICDAVARGANGSRCQSHPRPRARTHRCRSRERRCLCGSLSAPPLSGPIFFSEDHVPVVGERRQRAFVPFRGSIRNKGERRGAYSANSSHARYGGMAGSNATKKVKSDEFRRSHEKLREVRANMHN